MAKATAKEPFLPMFVGDFMAATAEWEGEEQALYCLLLMHQWAIGDLPTQVSKLARLVRWDIRHFEQYWPTVSQKFIERGGRLTNPRLEEHRAKTQNLSRVRAELGKKGADAKWQKDGNSHDSEMANARVPNGKSHPVAIPIKNGIHPIPSHPIHPIPEVLPPSPQAPSVRSPSSGPEFAHTLGEGNGSGGLDAWRDAGCDPEAMQSWIAHREASGKPLPAHVRIHAAQVLRGMGDADTQRRAVQLAIANNWQSLRHGDGAKSAAASPPQRMRTAHEIADALDPDNTALAGP